MITAKSGSFGNFEFDDASGRLSKGSKEIHLTQTERKLLRALIAKHPASMEDLRNSCGFRSDVGVDHRIAAHVSNLRIKMDGELPDKTSEGYTLPPPVNLRESSMPDVQPRRLSSSVVIKESVDVASGESLSALLATELPYPETKIFWERFNVGRRADGGAIEISSHFNLTQGLPLDKTGWSPQLVRLVKVPRPFDAGDILGDADIINAFEENERERERNGKGRILDPVTRESLTVNGTKFAIVEVSPNVDERDDLTLALQSTDYVTVMQALPGVTRYPEKRRIYGHADPSHNRIPNATGIHFIALFEDACVLAILRSPNLDYEPGTWSFSGEEQLKDIDLLGNERKRAEQFLLRTAVEEVFPLAGARDDRDFAARLAYVRPTIRSMKIWTVLIHELSVSFCPFGVFELGLTFASYRELVDSLRLRGYQLSGEGGYHAVELREIIRLLQGHTIRAERLFGGSEELAPGKLHSTSRYRLKLLLEVLERNGMAQRFV